MSTITEPGSLRHKTIFIVEDNIQNRLVFQMTLSMSGARVEFERTGREVVTRLRALQTVDLIILDLMLFNGRSGFDVYAAKIARMFRDKDHPDNRALFIDLIEGLFHIALADDILHDDEDAFLAHVAEIFGLDDRCYRACADPCRAAALAPAVSSRGSAIDKSPQHHPSALPVVAAAGARRRSHSGSDGWPGWRRPRGRECTAGSGA